MIADNGTFDSVILSKSPDFTFVGPGHNSQIITDDAGNDWMFYHTFWKENGYKGRCLAMDRVCWDKEGWPYFEGGVPSQSANGPVIKK